MKAVLSLKWFYPIILEIKAKVLSDNGPISWDKKKIFVFVAYITKSHSKKHKAQIWIPRQCENTLEKIIINFYRWSETVITQWKIYVMDK